MQSEEESPRGVLFWIYEEEQQRSKLGVELGTRQVSNWPMFFARSLNPYAAADLCLWAPNPNLLPEKAWIERASG